MSLPTSENPLLILAMDHRDSFAKQFGVQDDAPTEAQLDAMRTAKLLIYTGVERAQESLAAGQAGVLVDEQYGAEVLRRAAGNPGMQLAMPVEKSGQKLFGLEYGDATAEHIATFDPDYVKVLVRMNPDDSPADTAAQLDALAGLSALLAEQRRHFLYELLVPATDAQLEKAGDQQHYDRDIRPGLVADVIAANQQAGVEPALWKIEGLDTTEAAEHVVAAAKAGGRSADCIVLGRDAPAEQLDQWLRIAAPVPGFVGFAVGRSIWEDALGTHRSDSDDEAFIGTVQANYLHYTSVYLDAR